MSAVRHFHLFCGLGGGAYGGRHVELLADGLKGHLECIGGVDVDAGACQAFGRYVGVPATCLDLFSRQQYEAFQGSAPPSTWREAGADDLRAAAGGLAPDILVTSPPCKGFSGLLSEARSREPRYQALNGLTLRGIDLALEAWADDPPAFWLLENVPRLVNRGAHLLAAIVARLEAAGYETAYTIPDLGELGNLAQSRKRLHLVARHRERCPVWVFEPPRRPLRNIGDVLGPLPMPGSSLGPLHRLPNLTWKTWVRLALIPAGGDWRALRDLAVEEGVLRDYGIVAESEWHGGALGVRGWTQPSGTITSEGRTQNGAFSVADPRVKGAWGDYQQYGVQPWTDSAGTVTANGGPGGGPAAIADPRLPWLANASSSKLRIVPWCSASRTVVGTDRVASGATCIADPRLNLSEATHGNVYCVRTFESASPTVSAQRSVGSGMVAIADPRCGAPSNGAPYANAGHYGVLPWAGTAPAITAAAGHDNGRWSVADPREPALDERGFWCIRALDGTWHRPTTVLERAALQGLLDLDSAEHFAGALAGATASRASEWIGNAIPPPAMAESLRAAGVAILLSRAGTGMALGSTPIWVRPFARSGLVASLPFKG